MARLLRRSRRVARPARGRGLIGVTATRDGRAVFATDESRAELVAVRGGRVTRVPLAKAPVGVALSADERHLFVASEFDAEWRDAGVLSVVDAQRALDWDAGAARLLVASHGSRSIEMLPIAALR